MLCPTRMTACSPSAKSTGPHRWTRWGSSFSSRAISFSDASSGAVGGRLPGGVLLAVLAVIVAGAALLVPAIAYDVGALWALAVAVMALPQVCLLALSLRLARSQHLPDG